MKPKTKHPGISSLAKKEIKHTSMVEGRILPHGCGEVELENVPPSKCTRFKFIPLKALKSLSSFYHSKQ
jgi:hypothetical protein